MYALRSARYAFESFGGLRGGSGKAGRSNGGAGPHGTRSSVARRRSSLRPAGNGANRTLLGLTGLVGDCEGERAREWWLVRGGVTGGATGASP